MGALVVGSCAIESDFVKFLQHLYRADWFLQLIKMRGFRFLLSVSLLFSVTKADFAAELATFVNETPTGYIVEKMIQNGETCHCRVPDEVESSASSTPFATLVFESSSVIATTPTTAADAATTTTAGTTTNPTTTAGTTTNPTTTNPTTTAGTTTILTTGSAAS